MNILDFFRGGVTLAKQAKQNVGAGVKAEAAYDAGASLPEVIRAYSGSTSAKADDSVDDAVLAAIGEFKQTVYNASEVLRAGVASARGAIEIAESTVAQLDTLFAFLDRAEKEPLKKVLEG